MDEEPVRLILVTGGVISGVGKGIISSSLGVLLKAHGYCISAIKIDPYINIDAGTFSPFEHGEVFVLDDGGEVDLDLGNYERFLNVRLKRDNNITTGKIYQQVIERERRGDYLGKTVQTVPHITDAIMEWIQRVATIPVEDDGNQRRPQVCIIELGGTVGDIEGMPFIQAFTRYQRPARRHQLMVVHVSLVLDPKSTGEQKTKPTQNSMRDLRTSGLSLDLLVCRSEKPLPQELKEKIASFGNIEPDQVIGVHDVSNIYRVPLLLSQQNVLQVIETRFGLKRPGPSRMEQWCHLANLCDTYTEEVRIAMVGKYVAIEDAYASVNKALRHAGIHSKRRLVIDYVNAEHLVHDRYSKADHKHDEQLTIDAWAVVQRAQGILVPGGFGNRGIEGMIAACKYARENKVPFLGICLGMQCATIEFARSVCNIVGANSTEFDQELNEEQMVVIDMPEHGSHQQAKGGTMRLGRRTTVFLTDDSKLRSLYLSSNTLNEKNNSVDERHRHRYEINPTFVPRLSSDGLLFVGMGVDEFTQEVYPGIEEERRTRSSAALMRLAHVENSKSTLLQKITELCQRGGDGISKTAVRMEIVELQGHPYFVGVQFHPEYLSKPLKPSAPFLGFILAASGQLNSFLSGSRVPSPMTLLGDEQEPSLGNKNMFQLGVNDVYGNGIGVPMKVNGVNGNGIDHRIESSSVC